MQDDPDTAMVSRPEQDRATDVERELTAADLDREEAESDAEWERKMRVLVRSCCCSARRRFYSLQLAN